MAVPDHFRIIAHRGASEYAPENTRAANRKAAEMRVREFELDVQLSAKEGRLHQHCPRADRVTEHNVALAHSVAAEVRAWDINGKSDEVISLIQNVVASGCDGMTINWPDWVRHPG